MKKAVFQDDGPEAADADVVRRVLNGDVDAYVTLVTRYRRRFGGYAIHMLGNRDDAEDALQEAFVRAYRSLSRCEDPARFGAWFFRILVNRCRTIGRRHARRAETFIPAAVLPDGAAVAPPPDAGAEWRDDIQRALATLTPQQREAFLLRYVEELGYDDIAALTGARVSALKMRVLRACERMRTVLEDVRYAS